MVLEDEIKRWEKIHKIIAFHKTNFKNLLNFKSASKMHFIRTNKNDYYEILGKNEAFRKQSFRWPSKDENDFSNLFDDKDTQSDGGSDGDAEFNNELFSQNIGRAIHDHNDKMSKSSNDLALLVKWSADTLPNEEEKDICPIDCTLDTRAETLQRGIPEFNYQMKEISPELKKEEETTVKESDYFEMIRDQFLDKIPSPRRCIVKKKSAVPKNYKGVITEDELSHSSQNGGTGIKRTSSSMDDSKKGKFIL